MTQACTTFERPLPPPHLHETGYQIEPANEVADWTRAVFIQEGAPLLNLDHAHLAAADIAFLWTNVQYVDRLVPVAGLA